MDIFQDFMKNFVSVKKFLTEYGELIA